jgi:hypothetical protein
MSVTVSGAAGRGLSALIIVSPKKALVSGGRCKQKALKKKQIP